MKLSKTMMINEKLLPASKKAFTLAEVLITLSILGVVAALTIPTLVNRQSDLAAQTRIKKAISAYEDIAAIYMAENSTDKFDVTCAQLSEYFKQVNGGGTCDFTTADGVRWVFGDAAANAEAPNNRGNAIVYDTNTGRPRFAVVLWSEAGEANGQGNNNANVNRAPVAGQIPASPFAANEANSGPLHGYYNSVDFLNANTGDLNTEAGAQGMANAPTGVRGLRQ